MLLYTFRLGSARTLTDHEAYWGGVDKQMAATGDWLVPRLGHQLWLEKPPLHNWTALLTSIVTGRLDEATIRFPSALAGVVCVLLISWIAARLFGRTVGFLSGLMYATSVFMIALARQAVVDTQLGLLILAAMALFLELHFCGGLERRGGRLKVFAFWLLIGLMNLAKGPLFGAVLTLLTCGGWLAICGDWRRLRQFVSPAGMLAATILAIAWPLAVGWQYPEAWTVLKDHTLGRFNGDKGMEFNQRPFWYYAPSVLWQWLPWTPQILLGCGESFRQIRRESSSAHGFIWGWFGSQFLLLSCGAGKGHPYVLHALPALAPVAALGILRTGRWIAAGSRSMTRSGWSIALLAPLGVLGVAIARERLLPLPSIELIPAAVLLGSLALMVAILLLKRRPVAVLASLLGFISIAELYTVGWVMHHRDPSLADREFLREVDRIVAKDDLLLGTDPIGVARYIFYIDHPLEGYFVPTSVPAPQREAYIVARAYQSDQLGHLGTLELVAQSRHTRKEAGPHDRYTLFRILPKTARAEPDTRR